VIIEDIDGQLTSLTTSPPSEFLNQTRMLTAADLIADVTCWPVNLRSIAAFSDGLQLLCTTYPDGRPHIPFFAPMFRFLSTVNDKATGQAQLKKFLGQQHIRRASGDGRDNKRGRASRAQLLVEVWQRAHFKRQIPRLL
jgi:hypothetical protein